MIEAKHTPGPWEFGPNHSSTGLAGQLVVRPAGEFPHGEWVADVGSMYDDHREANARLIAAAPTMLAALQVLLRDVQAVDAEGHLAGIELEPAMHQARAAIAKATAQQ